jgi:hypothetical protein
MQPMTTEPKQLDLAWRSKDLLLPRFAGVECQWMPGDTEERWETIATSELTNYRPDSFNYKFNEFGYRCEGFRPIEQPKLRVLYIGCSLTVGIGLPATETWAYKLQKKINAAYNLESPYWNLAHGGKSFDYAVRSLYLAIPLLKPDIVFLLLPPQLRFEWLADKMLHDIGSWHMPNDSLLDVYTDRQHAYQFSKNMRFLELLAEKHNFEFFWSPWEPLENNDLSSKAQARRWKFEAWKLREWFAPPRARDGMHPGPAYHDILSGAVFAELKDKLDKIVSARVK